MSEEDITTITLKQKTKDDLEKLKIHPNQSFDELMQNILEKLNKK